MYILRRTGWPRPWQAARTLSLSLAVCGWTALTAAAADPAAQIAAILKVDREGQNHAQAQAAVKQLQAMDSTALVPVLKGFDNANPLAANWLASAFEAVADRSIRSGAGLPVEQLTEFVSDLDNNPRARRLAYEWLLKVEPELEQKLIPQMLTDPSPEFRRDAVQQLIDQATAAGDNRDEARPLLEKALTAAVDDDQVKAIVGPLEKMGVEVDLQQHFGFVTDWKAIGPFDNREMKGFDVAYPPETEVNLNGEYDGQLGKVAWAEISTDDPYGIIDIAKSIENYKGSAMYLVTEYNSPADQDVEFRLGTPNAWKIWVNGQLLFAREEYHRGMSLDQYRVPGRLKAGTNTILLKILQNEQTQDWAQRYRFQLRVSDSTGTGLSQAQ